MNQATPAKAAQRTWLNVEPYLYKNADSGRYYARFGRQGFRALKTDRVTVARLLVFTGMRVDEARRPTWGDVDFEHGHIGIHGTKSKTSEHTIPLIPECCEFLRSLVRGQSHEKVARVEDINRALASASQRLKIPKLTHHSLRHLFATICIESGVDIPTVSRWLGHADGGALAMHVYGRVRDEQSQAAAAKVRVLASTGDPEAEHHPGRASEEATLLTPRGADQMLRPIAAPPNAFPSRRHRLAPCRLPSNRSLP